MVSRLSLILWRWVVEIHDRLHDARDKLMEAEFDDANAVFDLASRRRNT